MPLTDENQARLLQFIGKLAACALGVALLLWGFWQIRSILPPFFCALVFAVALAPVVDRMEARGLPRAVAAALAFLLVFGAIGGLLFVMVPLVSDQIGQIVTELRLRFKLDEPTTLSKTLADSISIFGRRNAIPAFVIDPLVHEAKNSASLLTGWLEAFGRTLLGFIPSLIFVVLVPILALYAVIDYHKLFAKFLLLFPRAKRGAVRGIASDVTLVFGRYLRGLGIVCLLDTVAITGVLLLFPPTRPFAAALGLIAGVLYAVPYLGAITSTSLIALVAFAAPQGSVAYLIYVTLCIALCQQIVFDQIISPRVLGAQVGLHPILSVFALMAGNVLFGVGGMLLAVPVAASLQVVVLHLLPRLARRVDVQIQKNAPPLPATSETIEAIAPEESIPAGEGGTGLPHAP